MAATGAISGTEDRSGANGLQLGQAISGIGPISVYAAGVGNAGANTVVITNGQKLFLINETSGPAVIQEYAK